MTALPNARDTLVRADYLDLTVSFSIVIQFSEPACGAVSRDELATAIRRLGFTTKSCRLGISVVMGSIEELIEANIRPQDGSSRSRPMVVHHLERSRLPEPEDEVRAETAYG